MARRAFLLAALLASALAPLAAEPPPPAAAPAGSAEVRRWIDALGSPSWEEREKAQRALVGSGAAATPLLLSAHAATRDPEVRARAGAILLETGGWAESPEMSQAAAVRVLDALEGLKPAALTNAAARGGRLRIEGREIPDLSQAGPAFFEALRKRGQEARPEGRVLSVLLAGQSGRADALPLVLEACESEVDLVRLAGLVAIERLPDADAKAELLARRARAALAGEPFPILQDEPRHVVRALASCRHPRAFESLLELLDHRDARLRAEAAEALEEAVGDGFGYAALHPPPRRKEAAERARAWWREQAGGWPKTPGPAPEGAKVQDLLPDDVFLHLRIRDPQEIRRALVAMPVFRRNADLLRSVEMLATLPSLAAAAAAVAPADAEKALKALGEIHLAVRGGRPETVLYTDRPDHWTLRGGPEFLAAVELHDAAAVEKVLTGLRLYLENLRAPDRVTFREERLEGGVVLAGARRGGAPELFLSIRGGRLLAATGNRDLLRPFLGGPAPARPLSSNPFYAEQARARADAGLFAWCGVDGLFQEAARMEGTRDAEDRALAAALLDARGIRGISLGVGLADDRFAARGRVVLDPVRAPVFKELLPPAAPISLRGLRHPGIALGAALRLPDGKTLGEIIEREAVARLEALPPDFPGVRAFQLDALGAFGESGSIRADFGRTLPEMLALLDGEQRVVFLAPAGPGGAVDDVPAGCEVVVKNPADAHAFLRDLLGKGAKPLAEERAGERTLYGANRFWWCFEEKRWIASGKGKGDLLRMLEARDGGGEEGGQAVATAYACLNLAPFLAGDAQGREVLDFLGNPPALYLELSAKAEGDGLSFEARLDEPLSPLIERAVPAALQGLGGMFK